MRAFGISFFLPVLLCGAIAAPMAGAQAFEEMDIGDHKIEFLQEGTGRPVVFVHGSLSDLAVWDAFPALLSDEFNVIAYNQRYFGGQDWPDDGSGFAIPVFFDDLIKFVEGLEQGPVDLVTWSMGGEVGINATMMRPDLFRSAVHFEPVSMLDMSGVEGYEAATEELGNQFGPAFEELEAGNEYKGALRFIEAVFDLSEGEAGAFPEPMLDMWRRNARTLVLNF